VTLSAIAAHFENALPLLLLNADRLRLARVFWIVGKHSLQSASFNAALRSLKIAAQVRVCCAVLCCVHVVSLVSDRAVCAQLAGYMLSATRPTPEAEAQLTLPFWSLWHTIARCTLLVRPLDCEPIMLVLSAWARTPDEHNDVFSIRIQWLFTQRKSVEAAELLRKWMTVLEFPVELAMLLHV
jgi:hypothetical protein